MLIVCPTCATTYQIGPDALGAAGRSVRCAQCKNTWFATPQSALQEAVAAPPPPQPVAVRQPAPAAPPAPDPGEFDEAAAGQFSVEGVVPTEEGATEEAGQALAEVAAPPLAPEDQAARAASATKFDPAAAEDIETIAARRARPAAAERSKGKRTPWQAILSLPMLIVVLAAIIFAALQWRVALVRHFPQTASLFSMIGMPVNLRGLTFQEVKSKSEFHDGATVLVVEGVIVNLTPRSLEVPRLRFSLRNGASHEVYAWTALPLRPQLGSGDGLPFRTRLASPPSDGRDVIVRFFNRRDAALGTP
jgi:predicted Zn finger-like uncharacterized protein